MEEFDQYIPPLWVMCLESVAHLLVMINFSTNFIIYCSVSAPFKKAFSKVKLLILCMAFSPNIGHFHKNFLIVDMKYCLLSEYRCFSERKICLYFHFQILSHFPDSIFADNEIFSYFHQKLKCKLFRGQIEPDVRTFFSTYFLI